MKVEDDLMARALREDAQLTDDINNSRPLIQVVATAIRRRTGERKTGEDDDSKSFVRANVNWTTNQDYAIRHWEACEILDALISTLVSMQNNYRQLCEQDKDLPDKPMFSDGRETVN